MDQLCALIAGLSFGLCTPPTATPYFVDISADALPAKIGSPNAMGASAADLDGDGDLDLAIAIENGRNRLLINDGTGRFAEAPLDGASGDHEDVAIADYDCDGDPDLVFIGEDDQQQGYHLNEGKAGFTDVTSRLPNRATSNTVVAADIDGDGDPDLVTANAGPDFVWINDGAGHFTEAALPRRTTPEETRDVDFTDVDGDGDLDLYFANVRIFNADRDQQDRLLINDGKASFTDATSTNLAPDDELTTAVAFVDFDRDGDLDLIRGRMGDLRAQSNYPLLAFANDGRGHFISAADILPPSAGANAFDIEVADFNGDGRWDLFIARRGGPDRLLLGL